jgi:putative transposase
MARVVPSERFRRELDEVLAGVDGEADPLERIGRLGARLILQQALEDEVSEFLGRVRYERAEEPVSYRNGYEPRRVVTTAGPVELERPRVRNAQQLGFESRILGKHVARTYALESLVICSFLRGLSVRDVEAALEETFEEPVIGKSTVARVCQDTRERYRRWCERRLDEHDVVYCFLGGIYLELRPDNSAPKGCLDVRRRRRRADRFCSGSPSTVARDARTSCASGATPSSAALPAGADRRCRRARPTARPPHGDGGHRAPSSMARLGTCAGPSEHRSGSASCSSATPPSPPAHQSDRLPRRLARVTPCSGVAEGRCPS